MSIELDAVTSGYNLSVINNNFQKIEDKMNAEVLWRKNSSVAGEAKMERDLDMDGHTILNATLAGFDLNEINQALVGAIKVRDLDVGFLPDAATRFNKVLTFDANGYPQVIAPASGSAIDVLNQLGNPDGMKLVGGGIFVVPTYAAALLSTNKSNILMTRGYSVDGKGSAFYRKDGTTGTPSTGTPAKFYDAQGMGYALFPEVQGYVDYYQFGAVLDGATDDTLSVIAAHTFANANSVHIHQFGGNAFVTPNDTTRQIVFNTDCKYDGGFKFSSNSIVGRGFVVRSVADEITLSQSDVVIGEFVETRMKIPSLSAYANYFAAIQSTETDLNRKRDTGPALQLKRQPIIIGAGGTLDAPLWCTFNTISAIKLQSILLPSVTIDGFRLRTEGAISNVSPFGVQRNNTTLKNFYYEDGSTSASIPVQSLISVEFCYNTKIDTVSADPLSVGILDFNYVVNTWTSSKVDIKNLTSFDGWAQLDGNYCRNVSVQDSIIDRVGSHFRGYDYTFKNITARRGRCIAVAGGGLLDVQDIKVYAESSTVADEQYTVVALRGDYGCEWEGSVVVKNVIFDFSNFYSSSTGISASIVSAFIDSTVGAHDFMRTVTMPKSITIRDCLFAINNMPSPFLRALGIGCTSAILSDVIYPSDIFVDNITCDNRAGTNKFKVRGVEWNTLSRGEVRRKDVNIYVGNVNNVDPASYNETVLDDNTSTNLILTTGNNSRIRLVVSDCNWQSLRTAGNYIRVKITGGSISYFNGTIGTGSRYEFIGTEFNGTRFRGTIKVTLQGCMFNNYVDYTGASVSIGNGQNVDSNISFIISTATEFGATINGTVVTAATAKSGYAQSGVFQ